MADGDRRARLPDSNRNGNLYTGPNTEDTPTIVEARNYRRDCLTPGRAEPDWNAAFREEGSGLGRAPMTRPWAVRTVASKLVSWPSNDDSDALRILQLAIAPPGGGWALGLRLRVGARHRPRRAWIVHRDAAARLRRSRGHAEVSVPGVCARHGASARLPLVLAAVAPVRPAADRDDRLSRQFVFGGHSRAGVRAGLRDCAPDRSPPVGRVWRGTRPRDRRELLVERGVRGGVRSGGRDGGADHGAAA